MEQDKFPFCCNCEHAKLYTENKSKPDWKIWKCTLYDCSILECEGITVWPIGNDGNKCWTKKENLHE